MAVDSQVMVPFILVAAICSCYWWWHLLFLSVLIPLADVGHGAGSCSNGSGCSAVGSQQW